jgi:hypothetical protein
MSKIVIAVIGIAASVGCLAGWYFTQPTSGSGWLLFVAVVSALGLVGHLRKNANSAFAAAVFTASFGYVWFRDRGVDNDGWVLFVAIVCALGFFDSLYRLSGGETEKPVEKDSDDE